MSEIKQVSFRLEEDAIETFRKYCEENHLTAAQGFDDLLNQLNKSCDETKFEQALRAEIKEKENTINELLQMLIEQREEVKKLKNN